MQDRFLLLNNGQELQQADINLIAKEASLADDRVFAELLRLAPYNGSAYAKAILPYTTALGPAATVAPGTGAVTVSPFRAVVGSRTAVGTSASDNWQDVRSALFIGGLTSLTASQAIAANASGNPRWDLIYAAVAADANGPSVTRYVKTPATKVVTANSVVGTLTTTVTLGVTPGTPGVAPAFPVLPADGGGTFYIALAYVRVINGFTGASVLGTRDIYEVAPVTTLARSAGGGLRPADQQYILNGAAISGAGTSPTNGLIAWPPIASQRAAAYVPPSMVGSESLIIAIDLSAPASANWSHQNLALIDASRDWRNRVFRWSAAIGNAAAGQAANFPWTGNVNAFGNLLSPTPVSSATVGTPGYSSGTNQPTYAAGLGSSAVTGGGAPQNQNVLMLAATGAAAATAPALGANIATNVMASGSRVAIYADPTTGALTLLIVGVPLVSIFIWLDASAPYPNL